MKKLGIIGAMTVEVETLKSKMKNVTTVQRAGMEFYDGTLCGLPAVVVVCGVGKVNAAMCTQILCDCFAVTHIVNTGVAGSLCAELDIGDFVISTCAIHHDFDCSAINPAYVVGQVPGLPVRAFPADPELTACACRAAQSVYPEHFRSGVIASGDQFVGGKTQKQRIVENTEALCTEMEGAAIAHTAWRNQIPFVIIRAISDKADDSAQMDYPTFESIAARRCAAVTEEMAKELAN